MAKIGFSLEETGQTAVGPAVRPTAQPRSDRTPVRPAVKPRSDRPPVRPAAHPRSDRPRRNFSENSQTVFAHGYMPIGSTGRMSQYWIPKFLLSSNPSIEASTSVSSRENQIFATLILQKQSLSPFSVYVLWWQGRRTCGSWIPVVRGT